MKTHAYDYKRLLGSRPIALCGYVGGEGKAPVVTAKNWRKVDCQNCRKAKITDPYNQNAYALERD